MASNIEPVLSKLENQLRRFIASRPTHLMTEHDLRRTFAEVLLTINPNFYSRVENLQFEKSGDGVPPRKPVDLFARVNGLPHFVEFKFWHTMVKARSGSIEIGKGNATDVDYGALKKDFVKQSRIVKSPSRRLLIYLVQTQQYPGSASELVTSLARRRDTENAKALFDSRVGRAECLSCDAEVVKFQLVRPPVKLSSSEPLEFTLFVYEVMTR